MWSDQVPDRALGIQTQAQVTTCDRRKRTGTLELQNKQNTLLLLPLQICPGFTPYTSHPLGKHLYVNSVNTTLVPCVCVGKTLLKFNLPVLFRVSIYSSAWAIDLLHVKQLAQCHVPMNGTFDRKWLFNGIISHGHLGNLKIAIWQHINRWMCYPLVASLYGFIGQKFNKVLIVI